MYEEKVKHVHDHVLQKVKELEIHNYPFAHTFTDDFFPISFYKDLNKYFPDYYDIGFADYLKSGRFVKSIFYPETEITNNNAIETHTVLSQIFTKELAEELLKKFNIKHDGKLAWMCDYCWDLPNKNKHALEPHIDHSSKIISMIVYLPLVETPLRIINKQIQYFPIPGTDILIQNTDKSFTKVREIKAWCNRFVAFQKSNTSWHSVEETQHPRRTITMFIIDEDIMKSEKQRIKSSEVFEKCFVYKAI